MNSPQKPRWLLYHPESDEYIEVFTETEAMTYLKNGLIEEVTDIAVHELAFNEQQKTCICKGFYQPEHCPVHKEEKCPQS